MNSMEVTWKEEREEVGVNVSGVTIYLLDGTVSVWNNLDVLVSRETIVATEYIEGCP